jgi:hypothetical protein
MSLIYPPFDIEDIDDGFIPEDPDTIELYEEVEAFARNGQPIMIFGPTGTGKEFLARHYYKTLTESNFYKQWQQDWPKKYAELYKQYHKHYSEKDRNIFLKSLRVGSFHTINGARIFPDLADTILFGHERVFTGAVTTPGLLESIKCGVLFIDEVGDLPEAVQPKLLRAVDSEIRKGRRVGGTMDYSLEDLIIITATNRPRNKIREDLYYKIGVDVELKGLDDRPEDFKKFIPGFIRSGVGKRTDYKELKELFQINKAIDNTEIRDNEKVRKFAERQSLFLAELVKDRRWPGNLRALRVAIEASVQVTPMQHDIETFADEFIRKFHKWSAKYSLDPSGDSVSIEKPVPKPVYPSNHPRLDRRIFDEISGKNLLPNMTDTEINVLSIFLRSRYKSDFKLTELQKEFQKYDEIKHTSVARIRNCLNDLIKLKILVKEGDRRSTRYFLTHKLPDMVYSENADIFCLPNFKPVWTKRSEEIEELKTLLSAKRIYIQAPARYGKTAFITMFCHAMEKHYHFYYYQLGKEGLIKFFNEIRSIVRISDHDAQPVDPKISEINSIRPHLSKLFKRKGSNHPVLILDDVHYVSDPDDLKAIVSLANRWEEVILILLGEKMDIAFNDMFIALQLDTWNKEDS